MVNFKDKNYSIWYSKNIKNIKNRLAKEAKRSTCCLCGKECSSFCNSHSIPQFILENLSKSGEYKNFAALSDFNLTKNTTGKNNAGTFHIICKECDSKYFKDYENPNLYSSLEQEFEQPILYQIAIKNLLFLIDKANEEISSLVAHKTITSTISNNTISQNIDNYVQLQALAALKRLEFVETNFLYDKYCYDNYKLGFEIVLQKELKYKVPLAFQLAVPIAIGISGEKINDFKEITHYMHLCIFPLKNTSLILLFCHSVGTEYNTFKNDFKNKTLREQLEKINYIVFSYSEDYFINDNIYERIKNDENLKIICKQCDSLDLSKTFSKKIPNILDKEYSIL